MKVNDAVLGGLFLALSILTLWSARSLPNVPGQDVGPSAFPSLIAVLLSICAVLLILRGLRERAGRWFEADDWTGSWPHIRSFLLVIAGLVFYVLFAERIGYFLCAGLILVSLFLSLGVRALKAVPLAAVAALAVHTIFYKFLLVPLPWGALPVLW